MSTFKVVWSWHLFCKHGREMLVGPSDPKDKTCCQYHCFLMSMAQKQNKTEMSVFYVSSKLSKKGLKTLWKPHSVTKKKVELNPILQIRNWGQERLSDLPNLYRRFVTKLGIKLRSFSPISVPLSEDQPSFWFIFTKCLLLLFQCSCNWVNSKFRTNLSLE